MSILADAKDLAEELRAAQPVGGTLQAQLLHYVNALVVSLAANGEGRIGSARMLQRLCVENMDWSSPLFKRCEALITRALAVGATRPYVVVISLSGTAETNDR